MTVTRWRWLAALVFLLGLPWNGWSAEKIVWRAVRPADNVPAPTGTASPVAPSTQPVVIASSKPSRQAAGWQTVRTPAPQQPPVAAPAGPIQQTSLSDDGRREPVVRASSPDSDPPAPWPPPPPPADGGSTPDLPSSPALEVGTTIPVGGSGMPEPDPPTPGTTISAVGEAVVKSSGTDQPDTGTAPPVPSIPPITPHSVAQPPETVPPPPSAPFPTPAPDVIPGAAIDQPVGPGFFEKCKDMLTMGDRGNSTGRCSFQSDRCFHGLVSPVTKPFYFEDPRALTEIRPIFMYQGIPNQPATFGGGDAYFFGTQARVALTERFSIVLSELGVVGIDPRNTSDGAYDATGFAEIKLGPKYTFLRNEHTGTVAALGVNFELPVGSERVFQGTGTFSAVPYFSIGQTFGRLPNGYGSFNVLGNLGYAFAADNKRSEFFYSNLHLDYNVANMNIFYPLVELNWIHYTSAGNNSDLGTEGADLANLGSLTRRGTDYFSVAAGLRIKFSEHIQAGAAVEFPVAREHGLEDYRLTLDMIFRY